MQLNAGKKFQNGMYKWGPLCLLQFSFVEGNTYKNKNSNTYMCQLLFYLNYLLVLFYKRGHSGLGLKNKGGQWLSRDLDMGPLL